MGEKLKTLLHKAKQAEKDQDRESMEKALDNIVDLAMGGDIGAVQYLLNEIEGPPRQPVEFCDENGNVLERYEDVSEMPEDKMKLYKQAKIHKETRERMLINKE